MTGDMVEKPAQEKIQAASLENDQEEIQEATETRRRKPWGNHIEQDDEEDAPLEKNHRGEEDNEEDQLEGMLHEDTSESKSTHKKKGSKKKKSKKHKGGKKYKVALTAALTDCATPCVMMH